MVPVATRLGMAAEYEYLRPSIERFPTGEALCWKARGDSYVGVLLSVWVVSLNLEGLI